MGKAVLQWQPSGLTYKAEAVLLANEQSTETNDVMGSSGSKWKNPPLSQTEVLNDANLVTMILIIAASTGLHRSHKVFMMRACNKTIGEIALHKRDKLWACIRQGIRQLFSTGKDREATEILVDHIMLVSPGADRQKMMLQYRGKLEVWQHTCQKFDESGKLEYWNLSGCKISKLPQSFGALVCSVRLWLNENKLRTVPEGF